MVPPDIGKCLVGRRSRWQKCPGLRTAELEKLHFNSKSVDYWLFWNLTYHMVYVYICYFTFMLCWSSQSSKRRILPWGKGGLTQCCRSSQTGSPEPGEIIRYSWECTKNMSSRDELRTDDFSLHSRDLNSEVTRKHGVFRNEKKKNYSFLILHQLVRAAGAGAGLGRGEGGKVKPSERVCFWKAGNCRAGKPWMKQHQQPVCIQLLLGPAICPVHGCSWNIFADPYIFFLDFLSILCF